MMKTAPLALAALCFFCAAADFACGQGGALRVAEVPQGASAIFVDSGFPPDWDGAFSVEAWLNYETAGQLTDIVASHASGFELGFDPGDNSVFGWFLRDPRYRVRAFGIPPGRWTHAAFTFDGALMRIFIDGTLRSQLTLPAGTLSAPSLRHLLIGSGNIVGAPNNSWNGLIDNVRWWSRVLTVEEIAAYWRATSRSGPGLLGNWTFDVGFEEELNRTSQILTGAVRLVPSTSLNPGYGLHAQDLVARGSTINFLIDTYGAHESYIMEIGASGSTPGLPLPFGRSFPLNPPFLFSELAPLFPGAFSGFAGITDAAGVASAEVRIPASFSVNPLIVHAAYVTLNPLAPGSVLGVSNAKQVTITDAGPTINSLEPAIWTYDFATTLTLRGSNFRPGMTVLVGGRPATQVSVVDPTIATCQIAAFSPIGSLLGEGQLLDVEVINSDGSRFTLIRGFRLLPELRVDGVGPLVANVGERMGLRGFGFLPGATLQVNGQPTPITVNTPQAVEFLVPPGALCDATLVFTNPTGVSVQRPFNVAPVIRYVGPVPPLSGPVALGQEVALEVPEPGTITSVHVAGQPIPFFFTFFGTIRFNAPALPAGPALVEAFNGNGCVGSATLEFQ